MSPRSWYLSSALASLIGMGCAVFQIALVRTGAGHWWLLCAGFILGTGFTNLTYIPWKRVFNR